MNKGVSGYSADRSPAEKTRRCVIFTGGDADLSLISSENFAADFVIAADCGMKKAIAENITPNLLVGDFDSMAIPAQFAGLPVYRMPAEKDETDTMTAIDQAIRAGCTDILLVGGTGGRLDHTISNVLLLESLRSRGVFVTMTDGRSTVRFLRDETVRLPRRGFRYFSLFALDECTVTLRGAKYPLEDAVLRRTLPYAVSNEIVGDEAEISVRGGVLLLESDRITE